MRGHGRPFAFAFFCAALLTVGGMPAAAAPAEVPSAPARPAATAPPTPSPATTSTAPEITGTPVDEAPDGDAAGKALSVIEAYARAHYPAVYGGVELTDDETGVIVFLTSLDPAATATLGELFPGHVMFRTSPRNEVELTKVFTAIERSIPSLDAAHIVVTEESRDIPNGVVRCTVLDLDASTRSWLQARFGPDVVLTSGTLKDLPLAAAAG